MIIIRFPEPAFRVKKEGDKDQIFDPLRKRWILLTPEEWVRQNFIQYLVQVKNYPTQLIAVEKEIKLGALKKRFDILVYNKLHQPWMIVECKSPDQKLNQRTLHQASVYNHSLQAKYLAVTNGLIHYCYEVDWINGNTAVLDSLPQYIS